MANKNNLPSEGAAKTLSVTAFGSATISSLQAYKHGSVNVLEFALSAGGPVFIKADNHGSIEIGGTLELGTGTKISW